PRVLRGSTLFPYTTLFRSGGGVRPMPGLFGAWGAGAARGGEARPPSDPGAGPSLMPRPQILCRPVAGPDEAAMHHRIRHEVFVLEQEVFAATDLDAHDASD